VGTNPELVNSPPGKKLSRRGAFAEIITPSRMSERRSRSGARRHRGELQQPLEAVMAL
jgi:hypothetical protein